MAGEAYVKRYGAGGFVDLPTQTTSIDSQYLNGTEAALARLLGADPTDDCVMVWDAGLGRFKTIKLGASEISPSAGILKSQLAPLAITDADVSPGANIAASKLNLGTSQPGAEIGYDVSGASVNVAAYLAASAVTVITCAAHTFDGAPVMCEIQCPCVAMALVSPATFVVGLWEGATMIALIGEWGVASGTNSLMAIDGSFRFTPTAGSHTYTVKAYVPSGSGTAVWNSGTIGSAFARFTKV